MHLKKFAVIYFSVFLVGLLALSAKDILFILNAESQLARVTHMVEGETKTYYKVSGSYEEKTLRPAIGYTINDRTWSHIANYSCKDGCHKIDTFLTIFYKKENPEEVLISSFEGLWKYKVYFVIVMGILLLFSIPYLYYHVNKQPSYE